MKSASVPAMLVSTKMFAQSNITLPDGSIVKAIPINSGSILIDPAAKMTESGHNMPLNDVTSESEASDVKVSTKGRRPKSLAAEMRPKFDLGTGMFTERPMCRACGKYFMSRQQLNQHMLVHTDVRKYKCTYCERTFKQPSHLHQHHRIHTGEKPYRCPIPGCLRAFPQQSNLNHHLRNHDKPAPPPENTCSLCMRTYASETVLRSHISKIHMCDPETLLGARKQTPTKDISRQQHGDNIGKTIYSSGKDLKPDKLFGTLSSISSNKNDIQSKLVLGNNISSLEDMLSARKTEAAQHFMQYNNLNNMTWPNGNYASQLQVTGKVGSVNDFNTAASNKETPCQKSETLYSHMLSRPDDNLLHHFVSTTTSRQTTNGTDVVNMNETANNTEKNLSACSDFSQPATTSTFNHGGLSSETKVSDESIPSRSSRSRKRKAFQPQRIVQKLETSEEQEYIY